MRGGDWASSVPDHAEMEGRMGVRPDESFEAARSALDGLGPPGFSRAEMDRLGLVCAWLARPAKSRRRARFIWDDDGYVSHNETLRTTVGLRAIWFKPGATPQFYPLTFTSFWVEYQLWQVNAFGYHLTNVLLHILNSLLLWLVLRRLNFAAA